MSFTLLLPIEWNSIRLEDSAHGIVTKTLHKNLPGSVGGGKGLRSGGALGDEEVGVGWDWRRSNDRLI